METVINTARFPIGLVLPNGLYTIDGVKLMRKGSIITRATKSRLDNFIVKTEDVPKIGGVIGIDELQIDNLSMNIYSVLRTLNIDDLYQCAQVLVDNAKENVLSIYIKDIREYDKTTYDHSINVAVYAALFGLRLGLRNNRLLNLVAGALVHDIGKIQISKDIICKPGKLEDSERSIIQTHPDLGKKILKYSIEDCPFPITEIVHQHHENYDGSGYPTGLEKSHIYDLAMMVHICDVYDALSSKRSYKSAFSKEKVWAIMDEGSGALFDPFYYAMFKKCMPRYFIGEEIFINDKIFTVVETDENDSFNPIVKGSGFSGKLKEIT